jgi:hypothetical protein
MAERLDTRLNSGLGRPLDPDLPSNRAVLVGTAAAGAITLASHLITGRRKPIRAAIASAEACFMAWAIARELDPDEQSTAILAMPLAMAGRAFGNPGLGAAYPALLATRLASGTVGAPLQPADAAQVAGAGLLAGVRPASWPSIAGIGVGLSRDRALGDLTSAAIGVTALAGAVGAVASKAAPRPRPPGPLGIAWLAAVAGAGIATARAGTVRSRTDVGDRPIEPSRVSLARGLAVGGVLLGAAVDGRRAIAGTVPIAAAVLATAATKFAARFDDVPQRSGTEAEIDQTGGRP